MKTAMQEFKEWYNSYINENGSSPSDWDVNYFISHIFEPKEKEQIYDAFKIGVIEGLGMESNSLGFDANEEIYYNQTYKK